MQKALPPSPQATPRRAGIQAGCGSDLSQLLSMLRPFNLTPNPGADRTWSKARWKLTLRYCRQCQKILQAQAQEAELDRHFIELMLYGCSVLYIERKPR